MPKVPSEKTLIYSIKAEIDGATKIITLRVGEHFTELSLEKNGRLAEIVREERKEITHEKFD